MRSPITRPTTIAAAIVLLVPPLSATGPPCLPCGGVTVEEPSAVTSMLAAGQEIDDDARLFVRWRIPVTARPEGTFAAAQALVDAGATPWSVLVFDVPTPVAGHGDLLERQLEGAAALAAAAPASTHFEVAWESPDGDGDIADYAFLFKRVSTALAGASSEARVLPRPFADADDIRSFYDHDVAAYLDGVVVDVDEATEGIGALRAAMSELDPGKPLVAVGERLPTPSSRTLSTAAAHAADGFALTFFDLDRPHLDRVAPLVVLANEFQGDLSYDPASTPHLSGDSGTAWSFVRGEDLSLRVIVAPRRLEGPVTLTFPDPHLRRPGRVDPRTGELRSLFEIASDADSFSVTVDEIEASLLLRVDRATAAEIDAGGVDEELTVATGRQMPVEEIVRRLQAFEDRQQRRLHHYRAENRTHLRFQGAGDTTIEATFVGPFFFRQDRGFDWAWEELYLNGVRWRGRTLPEIPLVQPERAAAMPLRIHLSKAYRYELRGSERIDGRDAWVVDFRPADASRAEEENLYRGTVWIDKELFARVRSRALQIGLAGDVISNEETTHYEPVDRAGRPAAWTGDSFYLPTHVTGQQLLAIANSTTVVETETVLSNIEINGDGFADRRREVLRSDATMVRDTEAGLRYLVKDEESGERFVKEGFDTSKLFLLGGVFYDDALDYPLPLAGANYFSLDLAGTGAQTNVFFGGVLLQANLSDPEFLGSRFDAGLDAFAIAVPFTDTLFRDDEEVVAEEVEVRPASLALELGRPVGSYGRLGLSYDLSHFDFGASDDTGDGFVLPTNHLLHSVEVEGRFARAGYRLSVAGSWNRRSDWEPWGPPVAGSNGTGAPFPDFTPDHREFLRWRVQAAKNWHYSGFRKLGTEIVRVGGEDLDRFSSYQFGFFGATRVHGYQTNRVRAEEAWVGHLSYGFEIGEFLRLEGLVDGALATNEASGLDEETLAGVGVAGTFMGPWQTVVQVDVGVPVAGPDDGFVAYLAFLKLFE